ncbi:hypothetical protein M885DRAFT_613089 [Pelagophyceae sp. CCMP2097]|nr:hypothetical protein M885DRAFT_613089 [Pelagophyceae sp. CCMP2097]
MAPRPRSGVLIFLDVDGVLNTSQQQLSRQTLDQNCLAHLRLICDAVGARIIVSSAWRRLGKMMALLTAQLKAAGVSGPVGQTASTPFRAPLFSGAGLDARIRVLAKERADEILASVKLLRPLAWLALDDLDLSGDITALHFVLTMDDVGLTEGRASLAVDNLREQLKRRADHAATEAVHP